MKEVIKSVYYCDFCDKKLFAKHAMVRHEKYCSHNPQNSHACYGACVHLKSVRIMDDYDENVGHDAPYCERLQRYMYSFAAERKKLPERYPESFKNSIRMPKECEHWKLKI